MQTSLQSLNGQRVAISGGSGFLGSHLADRLRSLGAVVTVGSRRNGYDMRSLADVQRFLNDATPEVLFNLAANQGGVAFQRVCPGSMLYDNAQIMLNTTEAARLAGIARLVNVIAACAYPDDPPGGVLREAEFEAGPMHESADNYGITKRLAVMQAKHYRRQFSMSIWSVILANCYGPRDHFTEDRSHVLAALVRRFYEAKRDGVSEVVVWGRGVATRDLLYVDDAISGLLLTLERAPEVSLLNIATGHGWSVADMAQTIARVVGYEGTIRFDASKPEGPLVKVLDTTLMREALDWEPSTSLEAGVAKTLAWLDEHYSEAVNAG